MIKKFATASLGLLLLASPLFVSGEVSVSAQAQIELLLSQIAQLQTQVNLLRASSPAPTSSSSKCLVLSRALIVGSSDATTGGEVSKLQTFLITAGVYPEARVTGYYGSLTAAAVVRWQKAYGMSYVTTTSGVGPLTRAKLRESCSQATVVSGEYWYNDMSGYGSFTASSGPFGRLATIVDRTYASVDTPGYMTLSSPFHAAIVGSLHQKGDTCSLITEATVEIANTEATGGKDANGNEIVKADFVRLVSKGKVYDYCPHQSNDGSFVRTER